MHLFMLKTTTTGWLIYYNILKHSIKEDLKH